MTIYIIFIYIQIKLINIINSKKNMNFFYYVIYVNIKI